MGCWTRGTTTRNTDTRIMNAAMGTITQAWKENNIKASQDMAACDFKRLLYKYCMYLKWSRQFRMRNSQNENRAKDQEVEHPYGS